MEGCVEFLTESIKEFNIQNRPDLEVIQEDFEDNLMKKEIIKNENNIINFDDQNIDCGEESKINALNNEDKICSKSSIRDELKEGEEKEKNNENNDNDDDDILLIEKVAGLCVGYTGAEMKLVMKKTVIAHMDERDRKKKLIIDKNNKNNNEKDVNIDLLFNTIIEISKLQFRHFENALSCVRPSVLQIDIDEYNTWAAEKI